MNRTLVIKYHGNDDSQKVYAEVFKLMGRLSSANLHFSMYEIDQEYQGRDWASSDDMWP